MCMSSSLAHDRLQNKTLVYVSDNYLFVYSNTINRDIVSSIYKCLKNLRNTVPVYKIIIFKHKPIHKYILNLSVEFTCG